MAAKKAPAKAAVKKVKGKVASKGKGAGKGKRSASEKAGGGGGVWESPEIEFMVSCGAVPPPAQAVKQSVRRCKSRLTACMRCKALDEMNLIFWENDHPQMSGIRTNSPALTAEVFRCSA